MTDDALVRFTTHELPREELHALMARSDGPALRRTVWHLGVLALTGALLWRLRATFWVLPLLIAHGYVLAFIFCAFHETAHRTAFRTRWLNAVVGTLAGFLTFWPYRNYRVYHWEHHRHTQDPSRDPELFFAKPASLPVYLFVLTGSGRRWLIPARALEGYRAVHLGGPKYSEYEIEPGRSIKFS
jgi:fatty acid desaturase